MKAFKYRGIKCFDRDLASIVDDDLFAPNAAQLNDPTELVLNDVAVSGFLDSTFPDVALHLRTLTEMRHSAGIYSMSRIATDELMWAHYADGHEGFCIEYDLDRLMLDYGNQWSLLGVDYSTSPPRVEFRDITSHAGPAQLVQKMLGHKSQRWTYENELRIITTVSGTHNYARSAVVGVHFGLRCTESTMNRVRTALSNRRIQYSKIGLSAQSYAFHSVPMKRAEIDGSEPVHYAPIDDGAIPSEIELGVDAHLRPKLAEAAERARRDPSCAKVLTVAFSESALEREKVYVRFESTVRTQLYSIVDMYFDLSDL